MAKKDDFLKHIQDGNTNKGAFITLGTARLDGETIPNAFVNVPLKSLNRHGLIAGATGTGKTKTLQLLAERLSEKGIPVLFPGRGDTDRPELVLFIEEALLIFNKTSKALLNQIECIVRRQCL